MLLFPGLLRLNQGCLLMEPLPCWKSWEMHKETTAKGKDNFMAQRTEPCPGWLNSVLVRVTDLWSDAAQVTEPFPRWWQHVCASFLKALCVRHSGVRNDQNCRQILTLKHRSFFWAKGNHPWKLLNQFYLAVSMLAECVSHQVGGHIHLEKCMKMMKIWESPKQPTPEPSGGKHW